MPKAPPTHIAYALKRETRTSSRWLEIGVANIEADGLGGAHQIYIDRLPVGGFDGKILIQPVGSKPPPPQSGPERPGVDDT